MIYWLGILAVFLLAMIVFRVIVRRDYFQRGSLSPFSTLLEFVVFGTHANLPYLYLEAPWPQLPPGPENTFQLWAGLTLGCLGLLSTLAIMSRLGFGTTVGQQPQQLRQSGPYRWSRNPQLLTYGVMLIGCVVLYPSWQAGAWLILYGGIAHAMVITEEQHLSNQFGEEYLAYLHQVPRYIAIPGRSGILTDTTKE